VKRLQIDDLSIAYRRAGEGPALLLLHGFLCDSRCWRYQLADLSEHFDVIAWDAPGAGASSDSPASFTLADWSRCLAKFLDALDAAQAFGATWSSPRPSTPRFAVSAWPPEIAMTLGEAPRSIAVTTDADLLAA
jgi:pimeloyl-ACP methyl ester carboxylesterase